MHVYLNSKLQKSLFLTLMMWLKSHHITSIVDIHMLGKIHGSRFNHFEVAAQTMKFKSLTVNIKDSFHMSEIRQLNFFVGTQTCGRNALQDQAICTNLHYT